MSKFALLSLAIVFTFCLTITSSDSQSLFTKFKAKAGYLKAEDNAKTSAGMKEPKLQLIGTINQTIPFNGLDITIEIDPEKGTSSGWLYVIVDKADTTKVGYYFVLKPILGDYFVVEIPGIDFSGMGIELATNMYVSDYNWMDSDVMASKLSLSSDFSDFYSKNKPFDRIFAGLFVGPNPGDPGSTDVNPYWGLSIANAEFQKFCTVHAVDGTVSCSAAISGINDFVVNNVEYFPNPATDYLNINISDLNNPVKLTISDMFGRTLISSELIAGTNKINVSDFAPGVYNCRIGNHISKFIKQ